MARGETGRQAQSRARATYLSDFSVALLLSASENAAAPAGPIWLSCRLQRKRRVRDARGETGPPGQSKARATYESDFSVALLLSASESAAAPAPPMLSRSRLQRKWRVRDARGETGPPAQSRARATYSSNVSVELLLSASESAAAPALPIRLLCSLQRKRRVRDARGETGPLAQRRARATYLSDVSVALPLSTSESAAAPAAPIFF